MFVGAMGPPGGGRNDITARFMRHLQIVSIDDFDENTMLRIFYAIVDWHFAKGFESVFTRLSKVWFVFIHHKQYRKLSSLTNNCVKFTVSFSYLFTFRKLPFITRKYDDSGYIGTTSRSS